MKKVFVCFIALVIMAICVGCEFSSGLRVGYVGNSTGDHWNASYMKLDGSMSKTMRTDDDTLLMSVETEKGSIAVKVYDADKNLIYEADGAGEYALKADGRIKIVIEADDHKGSFDIRISDD